MATESDLRDLLQGPEPEGRTAIDLDAVLRRARARRRPRAIAASAVGALALVGVLTPVVLVSQQQAQEQSLMVAEELADGSAEAPAADDDVALTGMPSAASLNSCGAPVVELPSAHGLILEVTPVTAPAEALTIPIEVTLRNGGPVAMLGVTASEPIVTFSRDGIVLWRTNGIHGSSGMLVDLDPGESMTYATTFQPLVCTADDEAEAAEGDADELRENLPAAGAGSYRLSAAIDFIPDDGTAGVILVTGPSAPVLLQ